MPTLKRDRQGRDYYQEGAGDKVSSFIQAFMGTLQQGMEMKGRKQAAEDQHHLFSMQLTEMYSKWTPDEQKEFIRRYGKNKSIMQAAGLLEDDQGVGAPPQTDANGKPLKWRLRSNLYRAETPTELAQKAKAQAEIATAVPAAEQALETGKLQIDAMKQNLAINAFNFDTLQTDHKLAEGLRQSKSPFDRSLGQIILGRNVSPDFFIQKDLAEAFPDSAERASQMKFDIGPQAKNAALIRFATEGQDRFGLNSADSMKYGHAMTQAMYEGKYDLMNKLPQNMKTLTAQQLEQGWVRIAEDRKQRLQMEDQYRTSLVANLMRETNWTLNSDTANQVVKHVMYGSASPLSEGAKAQLQKHVDYTQKVMEATAEKSLFETAMTRNKMVQEKIQGARETIVSLLAQQKGGMGQTKGELDKQITALSDQIVAIVAQDLGLDLEAANTSAWRTSILAGIRTMFGVGQLAVGAVADKGTFEASFAGEVAADALGPQIMGILRGVRNEVGEVAGKFVGDLTTGARAVVDTEALSVDFALSGSAIGTRFKELSEKTPGLRVIFERNLKDYAQGLKQKIEASINPRQKEQDLKKLAEIIQILEGMGVK